MNIFVFDNLRAAIKSDVKAGTNKVALTECVYFVEEFLDNLTSEYPELVRRVFDKGARRVEERDETSRTLYAIRWRTMGNYGDYLASIRSEDAFEKHLWANERSRAYTWASKKEAFDYATSCWGRIGKRFGSSVAVVSFHVS